jgi:hypothetical protein
MRKQRIDGVDSVRDVEWDEVRGFRHSALLLIDEYQGAMRWADLTPEQQAELTAYRRVLLDLHLHETANDWADAIMAAMPSWL